MAVIFGDSLVVHGGRTSPDQALADIWEAQLPQDPSSALTWAKLEPAALQPAARHRHSAVLVNRWAEASTCTKFCSSINSSIDRVCSDKLCTRQMSCD